MMFFYVNVKLIHVLLHVSGGNSFCHIRFHISSPVSQKLVTDKVSQITLEGEKHAPFQPHLKALPQAHS